MCRWCRGTFRIGLAIGKRPTTQPYPDCFDWYVSPDDRHQIDLHEVLANAARNNITSILVEGGGQVFGSFLREIPLGRIARPEEIARIAVFLASEESGWITGELIHVNGGAYMA